MDIEELKCMIAYSNDRKVHVFVDGKRASIRGIVLAPNGSVHINIKTCKKKIQKPRRNNDNLSVY